MDDQLYALISIPHSPIEAQWAGAWHLERLRFQFLTVRLKPAAPCSCSLVPAHFNSSQSD